MKKLFNSITIIKRAPLCFMALFIFHTSFSQTWEWAVKDSSSSMYGSATGGICTDSSGNSYIAGGGHNSIYFHSCGTDSFGPYNFGIVARYDNNGNCIWVKTAGSPTSQVGEGRIAINAHGSLYVLGGFTDSVSFGSITIKNGATFIAKYDNNGNVKWAKAFKDAINGICISKQGNLYVTGGGQGDVNLCSVAPGILVAKLDSNGNCIWGKTTGKNTGGGGAIFLDSINNIYINGSFEDTIILGNDTLVGHGNKQTTFIAKYDSSGNCLWAKGSWDTNNTISYMTVDKWDNIYALVGSYGTFSFGCDTLHYSSSGSSLLEKLDNNGNCIWCKNSFYGYPYVDRLGNIYLLGSSTLSTSFGSCSFGANTLNIIKMDSSGNCIWSQSADCSNVVLPYSNGLSFNYTGDCYLTGKIAATATFGSQTLTYGIGAGAIFVAKLDVPTDVESIHQNQATFNIYPNPSAGGYTLQISASLLNSQLTIYDTQGRNVFQTKIVQQNPEINIPALAKGIYYVKLITPQGQQLQKSIVQE